jgi:hypothetical protein
MSESSKMSQMVVVNSGGPGVSTHLTRLWLAAATALASAQGGLYFSNSYRLSVVASSDGESDAE